jgi:ribosomal subunit interface protein
VTARHCDIGADVREFAQARLEKLARYDDGIHDVHLIVSQERKLHTAEITLRVHQHDVVITESHAEAKAAIELATERLEERVRRGKEKRVITPRRAVRGNGLPPPGPADLDGDTGDES